MNTQPAPAASLGPWPQSPEREVWFRPEPGTVAQNRQHSLRGGRCPHSCSAGHRGGLCEDTGRPVAVPRGPATGKVSAATRDTRAGTWMLQLPRGQGGAPALARRGHSGPRAAPGLRRTPVCKPGGKKQLGGRGMAATPVGAMQSCSGTRTPPPPCSGPRAGPPARLRRASPPGRSGQRLLHGQETAGKQVVNVLRKCFQRLQNRLSNWEPSRTETDLIKELFSCCVWLDGKLQLRIHGGNSDVDLENRTKHMALNPGVFQ